MRFAAQLGILLVERRALKVRNPMVEEVVGLGLERIRSDCDNRIGEFGVLVTIVEFAYPHVAGRVHSELCGRFGSECF